MTDWQTVFLGLIAVAVVSLAVGQVVVLLSLLKASRQMLLVVHEVLGEMRPLIQKANRITDDAARATALALTQVERVDRLMTSVSTHVEETLNIVQSAVIEPMRKGAAFMAAFRAVLAGLRSWQEGAAARDEDDPLFVG